MAIRLNLDVIPNVGVPEPITRAADDARLLRDRYRVAREASVTAQSEVERLEREDVEAAAARARQGASLGAPPAALAKARAAAEAARREESALELAVEGATDDVAEAITEGAAVWVAACDRAQEGARAAGLRAIDELSESVEKLRAAASTKAWIQTALGDGRYDRNAPAMAMGSMAPSSRRVTVNTEPLLAAEVLRFAAELLGTETVGDARGVAEPDAEPSLAQAS
jgi:hypothetical protein